MAHPGTSGRLQLEAQKEMAHSSDGSNVRNKFMAMSQQSHKLTADDYRNALMQETDPDLAKLREMAYDLAQNTWKKNKAARSKIESAGFHHKIRVEFNTQKCEGFFICHLFIHGIHVASKEGKKMKDSRMNAYDVALQKLLMPYLRITASDAHAKSLEASVTPFSSSPTTQSAFPSAISQMVTMGQELLLNKESNIKDLPERGSESKPIDQFVILEPKNPSSNRNVDATMRRSANMNEMLVEYEYFFDTDHVRCVLRLEDKVLADVVESSKSYARTAASAAALQKLEESCWTIKTKETGPIKDTISDSNIVTPDQLRQGISEGETAEFCKRVRQVIENYANSDTEASLAFTWDFNPKEKKTIRQEISRAKLRADVAKKFGINYCCVWRPYSQLFTFLKSVGGETKRYRLIPPKQNFQSTTTENSDGSRHIPDGLSDSPSTSLLSSGLNQNVSPLIKDTNQLSQQTVSNLFAETMTGASDASLVGDNTQPRLEQGESSYSYRQQEEVQERISSPGAGFQSTPLSQPKFAEDWPPLTSDGWPSHDSGDAQGWTSLDPSPSLSQHVQPPSRQDSGGNGTECEEEYCGESEVMSLEFLRKIVLLEPMDITTDRQFLLATANFNKLLVKFQYEKPSLQVPCDPGYQVVCHVLLDNKVVASGAATGKASAIIRACHVTMKKMKKYCWCIQVKQSRDETDTVHRSEFCEGNFGNDGGSKFSSSQSQSSPGTPQGPSLNRMDQSFDKNKVKTFLETLIRSGNTGGLIFKDEYSDPEVKFIQSLCMKVNLHFNTFHKRTGKYYCLSRKWTAAALFKRLKELGGESDDHKLVPPVGENGDTDDKSQGLTNSNTNTKTNATETKASHDPSAQITKVEATEQISSLQESPVNVARHREKGSRMQGSHTPRNVEHVSSLQEHISSNHRSSERFSSLKEHDDDDRFSSRNSKQDSLLQKSRGYNPRNSVECVSNLRETFRNSHREIEQDSRESERVRPRQGSSKGESHGYRRRNSGGDYRGSSRGESHRYGPGHTDDYGGSSPGEGHSYRCRNTGDYYTKGESESYHYRHRNTDDDFQDSGERGSHHYRPRTTGDDFHGRRREGHIYKDRSNDDYYESSRVESHRYRDRNTEDDYRGRRGEGYSDRGRNADDTYRNSRRGESYSYRQRDNDYGSNLDVRDDYKSRHDISHRSNYLEKRRYGEQSNWTEENSSPRKMRRGFHFD